MSWLEPSLATEGERIMTICNACRYCEGYCAVFPAMEKRTQFGPADLGYLRISATTAVRVFLRASTRHRTNSA